MTSLQDQLLKAGLVDSKKAKQVSKEKRKKPKVAKQDRGAVGESQLAIERARAEKAAKDRELNKERDKVLEQKAIVAQIRQLIENHKVAKFTSGEELEHHFTDGKNVKKIRVDGVVNRQIVHGQLGVAKIDERYELVPRIVAEKINQRDDSYVLVLNPLGGEENNLDEDDPYKDYQIPDDLMW